MLATGAFCWFLSVLYAICYPNFFPRDVSSYVSYLDYFPWVAFVLLKQIWYGLTSRRALTGTFCLGAFVRGLLSGGLCPLLQNYSQLSRLVKLYLMNPDDVCCSFPRLVDIRNSVTSMLCWDP